MSKSGILNEDSSWAQTFITVTPQNDGFLREIEDSSIVSGSSDVPLNLDTWNIVLRKSLINTTRDFIDPKELENTERATAECQTYLQGFPKVELPIVYRDEATQTLYIGKEETWAFEKAFDDIITVMNEKPLPEWKKSQYVQTRITLDNESTMDNVIKKLEADETTERIEETAEATSSAAIVESMDLMNFLIDRTLWMAEPVSLSNTIETKDAEIETLVKYNHATKKLTVDHEVQTSLTCDPKHSNSMLLSEYTQAKNFCNEQINECLEKVVPPKTVVTSEAVVQLETVADGIVEHMTSKAEERSLYDKIPFEPIFYRQPEQLERRETSYIKTLPTATAAGSSKRKPIKTEPRQTKHILLADNPSYAVRNRDEAAKMPGLQRACSNRSTVTKTTISTRRISTSSTNSDQERSSNENSRSSREYLKPQRNLSEEDERALKVLKNTFCQNKDCPRRVV